MNQNHHKLAHSADKYALYRRSVCTPDDDALFLSRYFKRLTGRPLRFLREDFCGGADLLCEFVKLSPKNRGLGIDMDSKPLQWCRRSNFPKLSEDQRERIELRRGNVLLIHPHQADLITAMNFSYSVFKTRELLRRYFASAYRGLRKGGVFILDANGGTELTVVGKDTWRVGNFRYVWQVERFDPITYDILCKMHFLFADGSQIRDAFVYNWRLWTLPEMRELLAETGFRDIHVLWEGTDRKSEYGNGVMRRVKRGIIEEAWYAMVVARK
ncbi:MAG TPA: class I SAM-dependent methyltransferase [Acidobacteriota bacterium]|nr:class I SAM-dependent methyltransferase [Acidobacteriota bacterium]